jgi:hypothetical protein
LIQNTLSIAFTVLYLPCLLLLEWRFRNYDRDFSVICLGMGDPTAKPETTDRGRLVILSCRVSNSNPRDLRSKPVRRFSTSEPVYAIAKLDEQYPHVEAAKLVIWYTLGGIS